MSSLRKPMRLPPLDALRVKEVKRGDGNPCIDAMSTMLACWASSGYSVTGCADFEQGLRACMDRTAKKQTRPNTINYHLARLRTKVIQQGKKKGFRD